MSTYHKEPPDWYKCSVCEITGVQLWRGYSSLPIELECEICANKRYGLEPEGKRKEKHSIKWSVPAIPVCLDKEKPEKLPWWGYSSVPPDGISWWESMPSVIKEKINA
jgi:hypothetical protein